MRIYCLVALLLCSSLSVCQSANGYERVKVAEGIYSFIAPEPKVGLVSGNQTVIIGEDAVLVIDSGQFPTLARKVIGEIRQLTTNPVRYVATTHWHWDHVFGNGEYAAAFPGVTFITTDVTRAELEKRAPGYVEKSLEQLAAFGSEQKKLLESGKNPDGTPMTNEDREYLRVLVSDVEAVPSEYKQVKLVAYQVTLSNAITLHLGKRDVELRFVGPGNTRGDLIAYVPDAKVLVTGDLLVAPTPYGIGSPFKEWVGTMDKLMSFDAAVIVPGHGPLQHDFNYAKMVKELIIATQQRVEEAVQKGLNLEETKRQVTLADFRARFAGVSHWRQRHFNDYWTTPAVTRIYRLAKAEIKE